MLKYLVFALVSLVLLIGSISGTSVSVAYPVMISSLNASLILAGWVLSVNQLVSSAAMPIMGKASDAFGRKFIFMASLGIFTFGSLLCAMAPNIQLLILFRAMQAIGSGGFMPSAAGIVADHFPRARQQALGFFTSIFPIGQIIGPNLGGWMVQVFGWRSVFWINVPLGIAALAASAALLRSGQRQQSHLDLTGAGLFTGALSALMVGLSQIGNRGSELSWVSAAALFAAGIALILLFIRHEGRAKDPIIDLEVLTKRPFMAANIYNFIYGACVLGVMSFIPLYAVSIYGMSTLESGFILTPRSIGMMLASTVTSISLVRWGYRWPMLAGAIAAVLSLYLLGNESQGMGILGIQLSSTVLMLVIMSIFGLGMGVAAPAANNACIELMPDRVATIVGIRGMFRQTGGAVSIAVTSLLLHNIGDMATGFRVAFFGFSLVMAIAIPFIFLMPRRGSQLPPEEKPHSQFMSR